MNCNGWGYEHTSVFFLHGYVVLNFGKMVGGQFGEEIYAAASFSVWGGKTQSRSAGYRMNWKMQLTPAEGFFFSHKNPKKNNFIIHIFFLVFPL